MLNSNRCAESTHHVNMKITRRDRPTQCVDREHLSVMYTNFDSHRTSFEKGDPG
jgi:hypothetical protein